ncbi:MULTISPECIES: hypothetical protein [Chitinophagaceae]|uniref:hypothetical protein n=1 Tax=Chitinophagaceae TaxID=563835 RepID=UPI0012D70903|nr:MULTISPECIES: hypothetical protein [Chitinophagaceae]
MKSAVLFFPDAINLKAFVLVEGLNDVQLGNEQSIPVSIISEAQLEKALTIYGAIWQ